LNSISYLRFLKTPASAAHTTTARVHCQVTSGPVSQSTTSNRAAVRLCAPCAPARTRTSSTEAPRSPNMLAPISEKIRKSKQNRKSLRAPNYSISVVKHGLFRERCSEDAGDVVCESSTFSSFNPCGRIVTPDACLANREPRGGERLSSPATWDARAQVQITDLSAMLHRPRRMPRRQTSRTQRC
jgi:hypothetical protein